MVTISRKHTKAVSPGRDTFIKAVRMYDDAVNSQLSGLKTTAAFRHVRLLGEGANCIARLWTAAHSINTIVHGHRHELGHYNHCYASVMQGNNQPE